MVFQKVSRFTEVDMPRRSTAESAGYDFFAAEDTIIPSFVSQFNTLKKYTHDQGKPYEPLTLDEIAEFTKNSDTRFTLVSTGVKCQMPSNVHLKLFSRSSVPLKNWLVLANGAGIVDADYFGNNDNEGEVFFQFINLGPNPILIKKGDKIGQGIFEKYLVTETDEATEKRTGGFGSSGK